MDLKLKDKMSTLYERVRDEEDYFNCELDEIDYSRIFFKAGKERISSWKDNTICMFKYKFNNKDSVLIVVSIPINSAKETSKSKNVAERIMEVVAASEECFTTLDSTTSTEIRTEKFIYLTLVKIIEEE